MIVNITEMFLQDLFFIDRFITMGTFDWYSTTVECFNVSQKRISFLTFSRGQKEVQPGEREF